METGVGQTCATAAYIHMPYVHNKNMSNLPDADQLLTLLAVAEAGNESLAAEVLGIGQSSISRRLAALQQSATTPLTQRGRSGTRLTPAGASLLPYAREVRAALTAAARLMRPGAGQGLAVRLGLSPQLLPRLAGPLLHGAAEAPAADQQHLPTLELNLAEASSAELVAAVRSTELDAALTLWAPAGSEPGLRTLEVGSDRLVLVALTPGELSSASRSRRAALLLPGRGTVSDRTRALARRCGVDDGAFNKLSGPAAVRAAVLSGAGVGVTLASYVAAEVAAGWLASAPLQFEQDDTVDLEAANGDRVSLWLLMSDELAPGAALRLERVVSAAVSGSAL